jgi:hypothetical protein
VETILVDVGGSRTVHAGDILYAEKLQSPVSKTIGMAVGESLVLMREVISQIQSRWSKSKARVEASRLMWKLVGLPF